MEEQVTDPQELELNQDQNVPNATSQEESATEESEIEKLKA